MDGPFLISQCYNPLAILQTDDSVVAPFLISQCYNDLLDDAVDVLVVAPFLISQCYNSHNAIAFILGADVD